MAEIPHAVLSEHFQERMKGRRLRSAVFLTYQFDPGFFEQEILPVFLDDVSLSHAAAIRSVQLEDALRTLPGQVAVYYDANGLVSSDAGSAKLDVRRIPVQHRTGIFHPKNVLLLMEAEESDGEGPRSQTLIVACLSANLTRNGWWENVEACHVEEISHSDKSRLRDDLVFFLNDLRRRSPAENEHAALREILGFLRTATQRAQKSISGRLLTHFYSGRESVVDFLDRTAGNLLQSAFLEVISPFFDDAVECRPLQTLIKRFQPKEVRVFLPRSASGEGECRSELYESVRALPGVKWGRLPKEFLRLGRKEEARERPVHAKIYRFFTQVPKRELYFVGSANLTLAAHQVGGNVETGFVVDSVPVRLPEFWLSVDDRSPTAFEVRSEDEASAASGGTRLNLRYHWDRSVAEVFWDAPGASPKLRIEARQEVGEISSLASRTWTQLASDFAGRVADCLGETSLFYVHGETDKPALLLVQEEGMSHKPSLLLSLSVADILRYWSLLTPEQRLAFLDARAPELALLGPGSDLVTRARITREVDTLFDRVAGFFHAFGCLERAVRSALDSGHEKEANYRLFGKKYDSLGSLLDRVESEGDRFDDVDRYLIVLCARQLCQEISKDYPEYWSSRVGDASVLAHRFEDLSAVRGRLVGQNPDLAGFLDWFDRRFVRRATPVTEVEG